MQTDPQRKAALKYVKTHVKRMELRFYPKEADVYEEARKLRSAGIKDLIAQEMLKKTGGRH